jgi:hypothetical protein
MDRIEPAGDSNAGDQGTQSTESTESPARPGPSPLRSRGNSRTRRPSIRLSRFPSIPSLDNVNQAQESQPPVERQAIRSPPPNEEDEAWLAGRRRSTSEPNPGRWSSSPPDVLARVTTPMRMMPVTEESSRPSLSATSPTPILPGQETGTDSEQTGSGQPEAPPTVARPAGRLRRTSQAALNRFSRNRASTVTGAPPTLSQQAEEQPPNEYGSHVVDVLDVIGKPLMPCVIQNLYL